MKSYKKNDEQNDDFNTYVIPYKTMKSAKKSASILLVTFSATACETL